MKIIAALHCLVSVAAAGAAPRFISPRWARLRGGAVDEVLFEEILFQVLPSSLET
jgi:hypothetical protein